MSVTSVTEWGTAHPHGPLRRFWRRYRSADASRWATVISWNALFSFVPIVLVIVTVFSLLLHGTFARDIEIRIASLGATAADRAAIRSALVAFRDRSTLLVIVSLVTLFWTGSGLFSCMDDALSPLYGVRSRPFFRKRAMAMRMIVVFAVLLIPLLLSSTLLSVGRRISVLPAGFPEPLAIVLQFIAGAGDGTLIFLAVYHGVPNLRLRPAQVLPGALVAGILLESVTFLFPLYFRLTNGFATYGQVFALLILLLGYFFFLGQIVMIGALVNVAKGERVPPSRNPLPAVSAPAE